MSRSSFTYRPCGARMNFNHYSINITPLRGSSGWRKINILRYICSSVRLSLSLWTARPRKGALMFFQVLVVALACIAASLLAITIASISLVIFGKFLRRAQEPSEEP